MEKNGGNLLSPRALFMPTNSLPNRPGESITDHQNISFLAAFFTRAREKGLTGATRTLVEDQINRTTHINIHKIHPTALSYGIRNNLRSGYHPVWEPAGDLNTKHLFTLVSTNESPFFFGAVDEGLGKSHFGDGDGRAIVNAEAAEWLKRKEC